MRARLTAQADLHGLNSALGPRAKGLFAHALLSQQRTQGLIRGAWLHPVRIVPEGAELKRTRL